MVWKWKTKHTGIETLGIPNFSWNLSRDKMKSESRRIFYIDCMHIYSRPCTVPPQRKESTLSKISNEIKTLDDFQISLLPQSVYLWDNKRVSKADRSEGGSNKDRDVKSSLICIALHSHRSSDGDATVSKHDCEDSSKDTWPRFQGEVNGVPAKWKECESAACTEALTLGQKAACMQKRRK